MNVIKGLLSELEREKDNTKKMIERLSSEYFSWKPHEKSMSLGKLANHIVELHNWVDLVINKNQLDFNTDYVPLTLKNKEDLVEVLENGYLVNKTSIESLNAEELFSNWVLKSGDYVIVELPKIAAIRFLVNNHLIHHRGQLSVYMRMLDIPVPGIYGPSADDK